MSARESVAEAAAVGVAKAGESSKTGPARPKNPKPTVGYIAVRRGWDPRDSSDRIDLWNLHATQGAAEAARAHADWLGCEPRMIVRVDTTFTIVDDPMPGDVP